MTAESVTTQSFTVTENAFDLSLLEASPCEMSFTFDTPIPDKTYTMLDSDVFTHSTPTNSCRLVTYSYLLYEQTTNSLPTWLAYDSASSTITVSLAEVGTYTLELQITEVNSGAQILSSFGITVIDTSIVEEELTEAVTELDSSQGMKEPEPHSANSAPFFL